MPQFLIAYHGGRAPKNKDEGIAHMEKWKAWIQSLGKKVINPGTPLPVSRMITASGVTEDRDTNAMKGFAVIQAENLDEAIALAKRDPFLASGGTIRLSQMMETPNS